VKASYIGFGTQDNEMFYQIFVDAMEQIGVYDCMMIHKNATWKEVLYTPTPTSLKTLESTFRTI
jgi:hypothetical protein